MLDGGLDPTYRAVLAGPHEMVVRVEVWDGLGSKLSGWELVWDEYGRKLTDEGLPILGGGVSASLTNRVTRNLNLTVHEDFYPWEETDLLAPYGNELRVFRGVRYGNGEEVVFPVFRGKIQSADLSTGGTCEIDAADRAQDVDDAGFMAPYNSSKGVNVLSQFQELITDAVPDAEFGPSDTFWQTMPALTWESDRGAALDSVGLAAGAFWFCLPDGRYVLRRVPWANSGAPTVTLKDGEGGVINEALPSRSREGVYNSTTAVAERTDGSEPTYGTSQDVIPSSPTYVAGKFGRKHKMLRTQAAGSQQAAAGAAADYVRRARSLAQTWSWSQTADAAMELGEVVSLDVRGRAGMIQVVSSFSMPLDPNTQMTVTGRTQIAGLDDD